MRAGGGEGTATVLGVSSPSLGADIFEILRAGWLLRLRAVRVLVLHFYHCTRLLHYIFAPTSE